MKRFQSQTISCFVANDIDICFHRAAVDSKRVNMALVIENIKYILVSNRDFVKAIRKAFFLKLTYSSGNEINATME